MDRVVVIGAGGGSACTWCRSPHLLRRVAGVDVTTEKNDDTLSWSLNALDTRGRLVVVTTFRGRAVVAPTRQLVFREATVMGSR